MTNVRLLAGGRRPLLAGSVVAVALALAVVAGCGDGDGDGDGAFTPVAGTESAYCDTHRAWQVHELDDRTGDRPGPAALEAYWKDYLEYNKESLGQAPPALRDEWAVSERAVRTVLTPVLEKYDFDAARIAREGTAAERAVSAPDPDVQKAQATIRAYEARVCGVNPPRAAAVDFQAGGSSRAYCTALGTFNRELDEVESSRFDPKVMRAFVDSDTFTESLDALEEKAPDVIAADQRAASDWLRTRWRDVVAEFDYDIRRIWLDGTPEDRAVFTLSHPDVIRHEARLTAYEEQVCRD